MSDKRESRAADQGDGAHNSVRHFDGEAARIDAGRIVHLDPQDVADTPAASGRSLDAEAPAQARVAARTRAISLAKNPFALVKAKAQALQYKRVSSGLQIFEDLLSAQTHRRWIRALRMRSRSDVVDPFGLDPVVCERWRPLFEFLYRSFFRVESSGIENIPDSGGAIIVANHGGVLPYDASMLMYALRYDHPAHRTARPLVDDVSFQLPFVGTTLSRLGCVRASQENAERLLEAGYVVVVFPEGAKGSAKLYSERHKLQRFGRGGFVKLALRTGVPVIPAAVYGADDASPVFARVRLGARWDLPYLPLTPTFPWFGPLGLFPLPTPWAIRFAEPIVDLRSQADERDAVLITQINERVRSKIQTLLDELGREIGAEEHHGGNI